MGNIEVREPIQKRSIEKKEKIISAGFGLICKKGYYNTNTAEIAKAANVSTGIIYQYFKNKHDILIAGLKKYTYNIFFPNINAVEFKNNNFEDFLKGTIYKFIENHKLSKIAHEEITSMIHTDIEVSSIYYDAELSITNIMTQLLLTNNFNSDNLKEKVHISIHLIDDLCHEIIYHKHKNMNYDKMIEIVVHSINYILK